MKLIVEKTNFSLETDHSQGFHWKLFMDENHKKIN